MELLYFSDGRDIMDGHKCRVFALMYHPTIPHVFISGGWDDTVQVRMKRLLCTFFTKLTSFIVQLQLKLLICHYVHS